MQSEKQIAAAQGVLGRGGVYVGADLVKAALEAALSAAEPVMFVSEQQLGCIGQYIPTRKEAEGNFQLALYRAPPAPSVAVKLDSIAHRVHALARMVGTSFFDDIEKDLRDLSSALSAQVQDDDERRTETCGRCQGNGEIVTDWERYRHPHDNDAGDEAVAECPDCDGIGKVSAQVQDVAGWPSQVTHEDICNTRDGGPCNCDWSAADEYQAHPDDIAVDRFAEVMKAKLAKKRDEGRGGWEDKDECSQIFLSQLLREHVEKGDPVDVGNLAMMLHQRGERIASLLEALQGE